MSAPPPVLPEKTLRRVLALARADGWSIVIVASLGGLYSLLQPSWLFTGTSILVVLTGLAELHGRRRLLSSDPRGVSWLIGAQLALLGVIWSYAWFRWRWFDPQAMWAELPGLARAEIDRQLTAAGLNPELDRPLLLQMMNALVCLLLAGLTLLYQGGMAAYYTLKRRVVTEALLARPPRVS
ncbi:hypothetical protein ESB00_02110 [Oleiharenicola lentus]|jgi:hypothetical protein|uniref:DUF4199 domain-containing protein n=1 Tax=Oleiharenicola lentus TaxID=2508720 RepID=A0A4Q1C7D3_9BACT|nr:hypothetical protein [Oleiharenicola lentus]RXK54711.1 hypothetical protein ESB00_02110 [Oleiharenicola lentus]